MITLEMINLHTETESLGATKNESYLLMNTLFYLHCNKITEPIIVVQKDKIFEVTKVKTLRILSRYLKNLSDLKLINFENKKDSFQIDLSLYLSKLDQLRAVRDKRMKDVKNPFYD